MTQWYVRPGTSHSATRNGTSYATAWGGWSEIIWGGGKVSPGDIIYICDTHTYNIGTQVGAHGASNFANSVTISGGYGPAPGVVNFVGAGWFDAGRNYTIFRDLNIYSNVSGYNCFYVSAANGFVADNCLMSGADCGVTIAGTVAVGSLTVKNCTIFGQSIAGISQAVTAASITSSGVIVNNNTIYNTGLYGISLYITSTNNAWATSQFSNYYVQNNTVYGTPGPGIYLRTCNNDTVNPTAPSIYSAGLLLSDNNVYRCGTIAGDNGNHGGFLVMGFLSPVISNNNVNNCYVTGAGIQTAKNQFPLIIFNKVSDIKSGTPTVGYQNNLPIDGNGIFFDILTIGGLAYGNYISNLVNTGNQNSGTGLALWNCNTSRFIGNVVENCFVGASYGHGNEFGNSIHNNTFINCNRGIDKVGVVALAGNLNVRNNIMTRCANGIVAGANPSIDSDYNCIHQAVNSHVGIAAGANDKFIDPQLDSIYRPQNVLLKNAGVNVGGKDFYGRRFYSLPNLGAVAENNSSPRFGIRI